MNQCEYELESTKFSHAKESIGVRTQSEELDPPKVTL